MNPKSGTTRFEKLCDFLTQTMEDSNVSRRIRLSAAMRLADLLERQQTAQAAEARRQERAALLAAKREEHTLQQAVTTAPDAPVKDENLKRMQDHLANISKRTKETTELSTA